MVWLLWHFAPVGHVVHDLYDFPGLVFCGSGRNRSGLQHHTARYGLEDKGLSTIAHHEGNIQSIVS